MFFNKKYFFNWGILILFIKSKKYTTFLFTNREIEDS